MAHAIFSLKKLSRGDLVNANRHDKREMQVLNADKDKINANEYLVSSQNESYMKLIDKRIEDTKEYRTKNLRSDAVQAFSVVLAIPQEKADSIDVKAWSEKSMQWLDKTFNQDKEKFGNNIVSAILHMDESSPHIHAIVSPVDKNGHFNAYEFVHGPGSLRQMQTSYAEEMKEFGLERGKKYSISKHSDLKQFYSILNEKVQTKAPDIEKEDTLETYKAKCDKAIQNIEVRFLAEKKKIEKASEDKVSEERRKYVESKLANKELKKEISKLEHKVEKNNESIDFLEKENERFRKDFEGMEHELGESKEIIIEKVKSLNAIQSAIEDITDPNEQKQIKDTFNNLIRDGKRKKRMEKAKQEQSE